MALYNLIYKDLVKIKIAEMSIKQYNTIYFLIFAMLTIISCGSKIDKNKLVFNPGEEEPKTTHARPNILWIIADDLGPDLNCFGESLVYTPNLDKLASEGVKYLNTYTVAAVCSVSRSTLITGMYPGSVECQQHRTRFKDSLPTPIKPITTYFKNAGYFVTNNGKTDYNFIHDANELFHGTDWKGRKEGQPFFSQIQIPLPHRPFQRDASHPIDPINVKLPSYYPDQLIAKQDWAMYLETVQLMDQKVGAILDRLEEEGLSENTVVFFFGDQGRPHVRAKQFLYDGGLHTPLIVRWPGKIEPGTSKSELISNVDIAPTTLKIANIEPEKYIQGRNFIGQIDEPRKYIFAMRDRRDETVDRIRMVRSEEFKYIRNYYPKIPYTQFNAYKKYEYPVLTLMQVLYKDSMLTEEQARFMNENRPSEELYDLKNDAYELHNLANDSHFENEKRLLSDVLENWVKKTDKGQYPEDSDEIDYAKKMMSNLFIKQMESRGLSADIPDEQYLEYWKDYLMTQFGSKN